jgi:hypothetical protein
MRIILFIEKMVRRENLAVEKNIGVFMAIFIEKMDLQ